MSNHASISHQTKSIWLFYFKPVDLLPFRIQDVRRQLESDGDLTIEALTLLRTAEDERRGKNRHNVKTVTFTFSEWKVYIFSELLEKCRSIRKDLISESSQNGDGQLGENTSVTTDSGKGMHYNKNIHKWLAGLNIW